MEYLYEIRLVFKFCYQLLNIHIKTNVTASPSFGNGISNTRVKLKEKNQAQCLKQQFVQLQ